MGRDNAQWLAQLNSHDSEQQAALVDLREEMLRGLRRALPQRPAVGDEFFEDAVQNALIRILDRLGQFEGRSQFLTWATSIAIRVAMSELRRRRWKDVSLDEVVSEADFVPEHAVDRAPGPAKQWERQAILGTLHELIKNQLTEKQRTVLLAELKGMPQDEIVRQLGSNRNALYKLTHDARKRLKQGLEAAGYDAAEIHVAFAK